MAQEHDHSQMDHSQYQLDVIRLEGQAGCGRVVGGDGDHDNRVGRVSEICPTADGSGTSRLPGNEVGHSGLHVIPGGNWMLMLHGYAWGVYTGQSGARGDDKAYVQSMAMLTAQKEAGWGRVQLKSMLSLEPLMKNSGYPNLFATGETAGGEPLVDRQHPHDLFMELAVRVDVNVADDASIFPLRRPRGRTSAWPKRLHASRLGQTEPRSADHASLV